MPEFFFNPAWKDSGGPTPLSWRFGGYRRWHPALDFLYEVMKDKQVMWASCLQLKPGEITAVRPVHQNTGSPQRHICDYCHT